LLYIDYYVKEYPRSFKNIMYFLKLLINDRFILRFDEIKMIV